MHPGGPYLCDRVEIRALRGRAGLPGLDKRQVGRTVRVSPSLENTLTQLSVEKVERSPMKSLITRRRKLSQDQRNQTDAYDCCRSWRVGLVIHFFSLFFKIHCKFKILNNSFIRQVIGSHAGFLRGGVPWEGSGCTLGLEGVGLAMGKHGAAWRASQCLP